MQGGGCAPSSDNKVASADLAAVFKTKRGFNEGSARQEDISATIAAFSSGDNGVRRSGSGDSDRWQSV